MTQHTDTAPRPESSDAAAPVAPAPVNSVMLLGRVSAAPESRELPSGDDLVTFRVVIDRPPVRGRTRRQVDVIDVSCWSARTRRSALALQPGDVVRVEGSLRRRFFAAGDSRASRYEVEAARLSKQRAP